VGGRAREVAEGYVHVLWLISTLCTMRSVRMSVGGFCFGGGVALRYADMEPSKVSFARPTQVHHLAVVEST
jgi:dienelactone hydrolase